MIINDVIFNATAVDIISELQTQLKLNNIPYLQAPIKVGPTHIQVQCPYHGGGNEKRPSAGIRMSDGIFHCFACGEVHSLAEVVSHCFGYDNDIGTHGWNWLLKNFATVAVEERGDIGIDLSRDKKQIQVEYVSEEELDSYRWYHWYWDKRGIVDDGIIELFDLGYDKNTDAITFPVRDEKGNCLFVAKRKVKTKWFNYPKGVIKPVYGIYEIKKSGRMDKEVFICESMIDCILLWQAGFTAVALNGTGDELQFKQLNNLSCREYILATDNDEAGKQARERIKRNVKRKLFTEIQFPVGIKDIGECSADQVANIKQWQVFS